MILSFTLENWMSFQSKVTLSMVASRERQHGERIPRVDKYQSRILPVAALYGGNASGKTNFFLALHFVQNFATKGLPPDALIPVVPFRLSSNDKSKPTRFVLELLIEEVIYEFSFSLNKHSVLEEKLVKVSSSRETVLYERKNNKIKFSPNLEKDRFLKFAFRGTRDNQLFLTNSVSQKVETFKPVYDWFNNSLELIAPDTRFDPFDQFLDEESPLYETMNRLLIQLDTGITHLGSEDIPFDNLPLPDPLKLEIQEDVKEGMAVRIISPLNERFVIVRKGGNLIAKKLMTYHPAQDGKEVKFEMWQESDGSQRIIDLLPAFLDISNSSSKKVYIIDEIDRSLHTLLIRQLIESYLSCCSNKSRNQLLFTTHDIALMDQELFRRDEMWVAERHMDGTTDLFSFSEYKDIRYDKDIRKSYLEGRLGGIPNILLNDDWCLATKNS